MANVRAAALLMALAGVALAQVEGRVLEDHTGEPLVSAELKFHQVGQRELAADLETGRDGRFRADSLPPGEYTVEVVKANHVSTNVKLRVPASGLLIRLMRYAVIAGTVRDTEGTPVPGHVSLPGGRTGGSARIAVLVKSDGADRWKTVRTQALAEGGRYRIFDLPPGQYAVGLWWAGLPVGSGAQMYPTNANPRMFDVAGGEDYRNIDFLVTSGAAFTVRGKIEGGKPKTQYSVTLGLPDRPALPVAQLWTENDGAFALEKILPGTYDLFVGGPVNGYGAYDATLGNEPVYGRTRIQVVGQNLDDVSVSVAPGRSLDVVLRGASGSCPKSVPVSLSYLEPWGLMSRATVQATFDKPQTLHDLAPARFTPVVGDLGPGCYLVSAPVADLSRDPASPLELTLGQAGSLRVTLRGADPIGYVVVLLDAAATDAASSQLALLGDSGKFEFPTLRPGRYWIAAHPAGGDPRKPWVADAIHMIAVDVPAGNATEVELPISKGAAQ